MCLAQGPQRSDNGEARTRGPSVSSQALYHWATALPEYYVIWLPRVILPKAFVLQDECFGMNYLSFLDFTRTYERKSGNFVPLLHDWLAENQNIHN